MSTLATITRKAAQIGAPIGGFFHGFKAGLNGNWEGGESSRFRDRPAKRLESADNGLNFGGRENLLSEARNLEQTYAVCRRINRQYAKHTVGSCRAKWSTGDPNIDALYAAGWLSWMGMCDLRGRNNFRKMTKIATIRTIVDGRVFAQKDTRGYIDPVTQKESGNFLQLQPIEGDRVSSDGVFNSDREGMVSGLGLNGNGRAVNAKVWQRTLYGQFQNPQIIPMAQLVHVFDIDRFDGVSGYTHYHTVLNSIRDLKETMLAEKLSAKRNSKLALLVKTILGGAPAVNLFEDTKGGSSDGKINVDRISDVADAYMFPNENVTAHTSDRPSQGWLQFMEMLIREIALGLDLPFGVVWNMGGLGGPGVRFEIMQASRTFNDFLSDVLEPMWIQPIIGAWIAQEVTQGRLPFHPNWYRFTIPRPKSISIDYGRDSKAGIAENIAGLGTAADWFGEEDQSFEDQTNQLAYEARYRECARLAIPFNPKLEVPLEQIRLIVPNGNPNGADPALAGNDDAPQPANQNAKP